ncbi:hypothetical protein EON77_12305 [bacterium]|nr:MAG: hypothetical protein EON77_12305 [bacterium]
MLLALDRYFRTFEKATPDFVARAWLGKELFAEHAFKGRTTERAVATLPLATLPAASPETVTLAKDGQGRMYYRLGLTYAPVDLKPEAADRGFSVTRRYEAVDAQDDVKRDADGTVRVRAGARVRVKLSMVTTERRYHVALVDALPAGFEPVDPALAVSGSVPGQASAPGAPGDGEPWWWRSTWYEHQNLRDERVEAFASIVYAGAYDYAYVARATTKGTFVAPPARAEEMYAPETFGRSAAVGVVVE